MKKQVRTEEVLKVYNIISTCKYNKMDDADKVKAWKVTRVLKPIATKFDEDSKDAAEKMKPSEDFTERLVMAQDFERLRNEGGDIKESKMGPAEYDAFVKEFKDYNKLVNDAVKEFADKEVEIEFEALSDDAFGKLMASNEWTMEQATTVGELVCE